MLSEAGTWCLVLDNSPSAKMQLAYIEGLGLLQVFAWRVLYVKLLDLVIFLLPKAFGKEQLLIHITAKIPKHHGTQPFEASCQVCSFN